MPAVWYIGQAAKRTVGVDNWEDFGITDRPAVTWEAVNGWSVSHSALTSAQLSVLNTDPLFVVGAPEGPRVGMPAGIDYSDIPTKGWTIEQIVQRFGDAGSVAQPEDGTPPASWPSPSAVVPVGGGTGQVLVKKSATDWDTEWKNAPAGSGDGSGLGPMGPQGLQGPQGIAGVRGPKGDKGDKGDLGNTGATGPRGLDSTVAGPQGPKGDKGDTGAAGTNGTNGTNGAAGTAATVSLGTTSTLAAGSAATVTAGGTTAARTFSFGIPRGADGTNGTNGTNGAAGAKGDKGDQGPAGPQGPQGIQGIPGPGGGVDMKTIVAKRDYVTDGERWEGTKITPVSYFYPDYYAADQSTANWALTMAAIPTVDWVLVNPSSGSGTAVNPDYKIQADRARAAGAKLMGYVSTVYGTVAQSVVQTQINNYVNWYNVNGIFLDEAIHGWDPGSEAGIAYYEALYAWAKANHPGLIITTNPGANSTVRIVKANDIMVSFESDAAAYLARTTEELQPAHYMTEPREKFWHMIHGVANETQARAIIAKAKKLHIGHFYMTDALFSSGNPWARLPAKWLWDLQVAEFAGAGVAGPTGPQGPQGPAGTNGTNGTNGTTPTLAAGTTTTLAAGSSATVTTGGTATARTFAFGIPRGADGAAGATGPKGDTGAQGPQGIQGVKGDTGAQGPAGTGSTAQVNTPFAVRYVGSAWEFASLAAAQAAGLNPAQTIWFIGGTTPPTWARSGDLYTQF